MSFTLFINLLRFALPSTKMIQFLVREVPVDFYGMGCIEFKAGLSTQPEHYNPNTSKGHREPEEPMNYQGQISHFPKSYFISMEKMEPWIKIPVVHTYEKVGFNCNPKKKCKRHQL